MFLRPCFLVVDPEHSGSISTRKLVLETAKYNVLTAYSCEEALAQMERFPRVHAVVMNGNLPGVACDTFVETLRGQLPEVKLVVVGDHGTFAGVADRTVPSFMPAELLRVLRELFPEQDRTLQKHEAELQAREQ